MTFYSIVRNKNGICCWNAGGASIQGDDLTLVFYAVEHNLSWSFSQAQREQLPLIGAFRGGFERAEMAFGPEYDYIMEEYSRGGRARERLEKMVGRTVFIDWD